MLASTRGTLGLAFTPLPQRPRLRQRAQAASSSSSSPGDEEPLRVVFVSTEVAPWSKVGGLADVIASLPTALSARGHTVVTVSPRYAPYPDTLSTAISVPLELPLPSPDEEDASTSSEIINNNSTPLPIEEPISSKNRRRGRRRKQQLPDTIAAGTEFTPLTTTTTTTDDIHDNQTSSGFPLAAELFSVQQGGVERVFVDHPALRTDSIYGPPATTAACGSGGGGGALTYLEAGDMKNLDLRYSILCQAALGAAALLPTLNSSSSTTTTQGSGGNSRRSESGIVFVANDWPTALQLLRLTYIVRRRDTPSCTCTTGSTANIVPSFAVPSLASTLSTERDKSDEECGGGGGGGGEIDFRSLLSSRLLTAATVMCIHNLAYQGVFPSSTFSQLCLPDQALEALNSSSDWRTLFSFPPAANSASPRAAIKGQLRSAAANVNNSSRGGGGGGGRHASTPFTNHSASTGMMQLISSREIAVIRAFARRAADDAGLGGSGCGGAMEEEQEVVVGDLNFMRAALLCADEVVTVSPNYADEIQTQADMGCGLQDILVAKGVTGIMNGIDTEEWNPATDHFLPEEGRFNAESMLAGKAFMKVQLQRRLGLTEDPDAPLVVFIGRLTEQKGLDILLGALPAVLAGQPAPAPVVMSTPIPSLNPTNKNSTNSRRNTSNTSDDAANLQLAMLGTGEAWIQAALGGLEKSFPGQAVGVTAFSEELAHWLLAAADYVLVPSRFEPCGLVAQCGARYGAVPIVTAVGGLKDLVTPGVVGHVLPPLGPAGDAASRRMDVNRLAAMLQVVSEECGTDVHRELQRFCMEMDLSWEQPAREWEVVLRRVARQRVLDTLFF